MPKIQIGLFIIAILIVIGIYSLPTAVVTNEEKSLASNPDQASDSPPGSDQHSPSRSLPDSLTEIFNNLRIEFLAANSEKKIIFADSMARLFKSIQFLDSAVHYQEKIYQLDPNAEHLNQLADIQYDAYNFYGIVDAQKANEFKKAAVQAFDKILAENPDNLDAQAKLAMIKVAGENPMQGVLKLREILEKNPNHEISLFNLGLLSMQTKQYDRAVQRFEKLLSVNPENADAKLFLSQAYANNGQKDAAVNLLQDILKTERDSLLRSTAQDYLNQIN